MFCSSIFIFVVTMVEIVESCWLEPTLIFSFLAGVYFIGLEHSGISNEARKRYLQIMCSFTSPMRGQLISIRSWTQ